jgi:hypothetical protein
METTSFFVAHLYPHALLQLRVATQLEETERQAKRNYA